MKRVFTKLAFRDFSLACNACSALATKGVGKVLMLLMLIGLCSSSALAKTISIGTGQTYTTLSAANGNLNDGDTLILTSDVNVGGSITWDKNITIKGNGHVIKRAGNNQRITIKSTVSLDGVVLDGDGKTPSQYFITISGTSSKLIMDAASKITNVRNFPAVNLDGGSLIGGQITECTNTNNNNGIVYVSNANSVLSNCRITGNTISNNNDACVVYLSGKMVNCVVADNNNTSASPQAIAAYKGSYVINCTITNNSHMYGYYRMSGTTYLYNSIFYGNSYNKSWNSPTSFNCVTDNPNLSSDYSLTVNSTNCIDKGNNNYYLDANYGTVDIVGNPRKDGTIDIGAFEFKKSSAFYATLTAKIAGGANLSSAFTGSLALTNSESLYWVMVNPSVTTATRDVTVTPSASLTSGGITYLFDHWESSTGTVVSGNTLTFKQDKNNANQYVAIYKARSYFWMNVQTDEGVEIPRANYVSGSLLKYEDTEETSGIKNEFTVSKMSTTFSEAELATDMPDITYASVIYEFDHWEKMSNGSQVCTHPNNFSQWTYGDATWTTTNPVQNPVLTTTNSNTKFWRDPQGTGNTRNRNSNYTYYTAVYKIKGTTYYATLTAKDNTGAALNNNNIAYTCTTPGFDLTKKNTLYSVSDPTMPTDPTKTVTIQATSAFQDGETNYEFRYWEDASGTRVNNPLTFSTDKTEKSYVAVYKKIGKCAGTTITATKTTDLVWGKDQPVITVNYTASVIYSTMWQGSNDGLNWSNVTDNFVSTNNYKVIYDKNSYKYYRAKIASPSDTCFSDKIELKAAGCEVSLEVVDASGNPLRQQFTVNPTLNSYVVEGETQYTIRLKTINTSSAVITHLHQRIPETDGTDPNDNTVWTWPSKTPDKKEDVNNNSFTIPSADVTYEYEIKYTDCSGQEKTEHCIVRVDFSCKSNDSEVIWKDNFGSFNGNTYTYFDYEQNKSVSKTATNGRIADPTGSIHEQYTMIRDGVSNTQGYYCIATTASKLNNAFKSGTEELYDHTDNTHNGGMMVVDFGTDATKSLFYQRDIPARNCDGALVYLSCCLAGIQGQDMNGSNRVHEANVRMEVWALDVNKNDSVQVATFYSGDVPNPNHGETDWVNLSAYFKMEKGVRYRMKLHNNKYQRYGNDVRFDDISAVACYPSLQITDDPKVVDESKTGVVICGTESDTITLYASVGGDIRKYYDHPYYRYQYRKDSTSSVWIDFNGQNHDVDSCRIAMLDVDPGVQMRAIVAKDSAMVDWVCKSYTDSAKKYTDPADEAKRYPKVDCAHPYGYSHGFTIDYFPALEKLEAGKTQYECIGKEHTLSAKIPEQYTNIQWYDVNDEVGSLISGANSSSYQFTMDKSYKEHWLVVKNEQGECPDTVRFVTQQNTSVSLECLDDLRVAASDECQFVYRLRPEASSCVPDAVYSYSYKLSENDTYTPWDTTVGITLPLGVNTIYWKVLMTSEAYGIVEALNIVDSCSQSIIVADSTAPVLAAISDSLLDFSLNGCAYEIPDLSTVALSAATDNCTAKANLTFVEQSVSAGYEYTQTDAQQTIPVVVKVKDEAGNIGEQTVNVIIPANDFSFVCANYAFLSEDGQIEFDCPAVTPAGSVVEWSTNNSALSVTGGKISGTLPFGNTSVTISAGKCNKTIDCPTTITVIKRADACGHDE